MAMSAQPNPSSKPDPLLTAAYGVSIFASAAHHPIPDDAHEYQIRKALNDAAYASLAYVPYCACMPTCAKCETPQWCWKKK